MRYLNSSSLTAFVYTSIQHMPLFLQLHFLKHFLSELGSGINRFGLKERGKLTELLTSAVAGSRGRQQRWRTGQEEGSGGGRYISRSQGLQRKGTEVQG